MNFFQYLVKAQFPPPRIRVREDQHRVASSLELFIDLAFVGMLAVLVRYIAESDRITMEVMELFLLRFLSTFTIWYNLIWYNLIWYNNLFETSSLRHRGLIFLAIFSITMQQLSANIDTRGQYYFMMAGFVLSRLFIANIWLMSPIRGFSLFMLVIGINNAFYKSKNPDPARQPLETRSVRRTQYLTYLFAILCLALALTHTSGKLSVLAVTGMMFIWLFAKEIIWYILLRFPE